MSLPVKPKMRAVVKFAEGPGNVEVREVPTPELGSRDVLIAVRACTVDMTDVDIWRWKPPMGVPITRRQAPWMRRSWVKIPVILGAEIAGEVVKVGSDVRRVGVGDRVVVKYGLEPCGECPQCRLGHYELCEAVIQVGRMTDGGFAEYIKVPEAAAIKFPDNLTFEEAAPTEMVVTAFHSFWMTRVRPGMTVAIFGPGVVGLFAVQIAKTYGARKVILIGVTGDEKRLELGKELGADVIINSSKEDVFDVVMRETDDMGVDLALDFTGHPEAINKAFDIVTVRGTIHCTGNPRTGIRGEVTVPWIAINAKEITITGSKVWRATTDEWLRALDLMRQGKIKTRPLLGNRYPLEKWQEAFEARESRRELLPVIVPWG